MSKRSFATVAVLAGLLATATPAHAGTLVGNPGKGTAVIESIGTKYTMFFPLQVDAAKKEVATETIESPAVFSGAYDNEMGLRAARLLPEIDDEVLLRTVAPVRAPTR